MDTFKFDNLKTEKANAMLRYRRLRNVAKFFRILEFCLALLFLSWTSSRLPFIVKISRDYFRQLIALVISPLFIFLLGNVIVLTLLAKSGLLTAQSSANLCDEFTRNIENSIKLEPDNCPPLPEPEEIIYQDKQIICGMNTVTSAPNYDAIELTLVADQSVSDQKVYRRSQSENLKGEDSEKPCGKLRRSETEKFLGIERSGAETLELVDKLSNEEFQRTIEAFIAKQLRFHKEEKLAIVLPQPSHAHS